MRFFYYNAIFDGGKVQRKMVTDCGMSGEGSDAVCCVYL